MFIARTQNYPQRPLRSKKRHLIRCILILNPRNLQHIEKPQSAPTTLWNHLCLYRRELRLPQTSIIQPITTNLWMASKSGFTPLAHPHGYKMSSHIYIQGQKRRLTLHHFRSLEAYPMYLNKKFTEGPIIFRITTNYFLITAPHQHHNEQFLSIVKKNY